MWPLQGQGRQWGNPKYPARQRLQRWPPTSRRQEHCPVTWSHSVLSEPCGWHSHAGKHQKKSCVLKALLPTHLIPHAAQRQQGWKICFSWEHFLYCLTHNPGFKAPKNWGIASGTGSGAGCKALTIAAMETKAIAACRAGVTAASHDVDFALTLAPQFTTASIQRPLGIALACWQGERKSKQVCWSRSCTVLISFRFHNLK